MKETDEIYVRILNLLELRVPTTNKGYILIFSVFISLGILGVVGLTL